MVAHDETDESQSVQGFCQQVAVLLNTSVVYASVEYIRQGLVGGLVAQRVPDKADLRSDFLVSYALHHRFLALEVADVRSQRTHRKSGAPHGSAYIFIYMFRGRRTFHGSAHGPSAVMYLKNEEEESQAPGLLSHVGGAR